MLAHFETQHRMQHRSLNFRFKTEASLDAGHPRGEKFAAGLLKLFSARYGFTERLEIWRDCGWECPFSADDEEYLFVLSVLEDDSTLIQISPRRLPNALTRLFDQTASASDEGLQRRREELEAMLRDTLRGGAIAITYDGLPSLEGPA
jgi:hypothetical protein